MRKPIDRRRLIAGSGFRLAAIDPASKCGLGTKDAAQEKLTSDLERLSNLQDVFYAAGRFALLIVFQGMDASGKDGVIRHVMAGVNPQGVDVHSFKEPSPEELAHDYLWRASKALPARGHIAIFNRSYYEELAVVRVHASVLANENVPAPKAESTLWSERFEDIVAFERHLARNGTIVLKFFLHISKDEQRDRLLARIDTPEKHWKLSASDVRERTFWDRYQHAYEAILTHTSTDFAPWYVVPANHKWVARAVVADTIVARLRELKLNYPRLTESEREQLALDRARLQQS